MTSGTMNFTGVKILIADGDSHAVSILQQMLRGFGANQHTAVASAAEAKEKLAGGGFDLFICETVLPDMSGLDLIKWLRRCENAMVRFTPVVILTGYTQYGRVADARDAGANIVVKKPSSPATLYDHIAWTANTPRPFIDVPSYAGPDRRFKFEGLPNGVGRRETDLQGDIGQATEPNMSQDEIDNLFKPTKAAL